MTRLSIALQVVTVLLLGLILLRVGSAPQATPANTLSGQALDRTLAIVEKRLDRLVLIGERAYEELRAVCDRLPSSSVIFTPQCANAGLPPAGSDFLP